MARSMARLENRAKRDPESSAARPLRGRQSRKPRRSLVRGASRRVPGSGPSRQGARDDRPSQPPRAGHRAGDRAVTARTSPPGRRMARPAPASHAAHMAQRLLPKPSARFRPRRPRPALTSALRSVRGSDRERVGIGELTEGTNEMRWFRAILGNWGWRALATLLAAGSAGCGLKFFHGPDEHHLVTDEMPKVEFRPGGGDVVWRDDSTEEPVRGRVGAVFKYFCGYETWKPLYSGSNRITVVRWCQDRSLPGVGIDTGAGQKLNARAAADRWERHLVEEAVLRDAPEVLIRANHERPYGAPDESSELFAIVPGPYWSGNRPPVPQPAGAYRLQDQVRSIPYFAVPSWWTTLHRTCDAPEDWLWVRFEVPYVPTSSARSSRGRER